MSRNGRVLVVAPHPDDEAFGCGGTVRGHALAGEDVNVVFLTSGEAGGHGRTPEETGPLREAEARASAEILGARTCDFWRLPDGRVRADAALVDRLRDALHRLAPSRVYVTHGMEEHADHRAAARAVTRAVRSLPRPPTVWSYEVWTPLTRMGALVDISDHIDVKVAALRAHASQCAVLRFDESALGLARYRGEMHNWPGGPYAEAFEVTEP